MIAILDQARSNIIYPETITLDRDRSIIKVRDNNFEIKVVASYTTLERAQKVFTDIFLEIKIGAKVYLMPTE